MLNSRRFLNLVHYWVREQLSQDEEKFNEFERSLISGNRADGAPSWWTDDDDAASSSMALARELGLNV